MPKMRARKWASAATALALATTLAACGSSSESPKDSASSGSATTPVSGGALTFYEPVSYEAWAPTDSSFANTQVTNNIAERLVWQDPATGKFKPWLAKSWKLSADHRTYTFKLRDGVTFSNGDPLDAETVKRNFDQHGKGDKKLGIPPDPLWGNYAGTKAVGDSTVEVTLTEPDAGFLPVLANYRSSSILAKPFLARDLNGQSKLENWIGTGPFVVESVAGTTGVTLKRRDDYNWAPSGAAHQGKAYLSKVVFKTVPEASTRVGALSSGEAQVSRNISPYDEETVAAQGGKLVAVPVPGEVNGLAIRGFVKGAPTQDVRVRQALQAASDRREINTTALSPSYGIPTSALSKGTPFQGDSTKFLTYDLAKAKRLLDEAGWTVGPDGIREKAGKRLSLNVRVSPYYSLSEPVTELLQSQWKKAGIEIELSTPSMSQYDAQDAKAPTDWIFEQGLTSSADPNALRAAWSSKNQDNFKNEPADTTLDDLLEKQSQLFDDGERQKAVQAIEDHVFQKAYFIPLYDETLVYGVAPKVHNFKTEITARTWLYDTWLAK